MLKINIAYLQKGKFDNATNVFETPLKKRQKSVHQLVNYGIDQIFCTPLNLYASRLYSTNLLSN